MKVIAFGHKKRVGKDTAVKFALSFARQYFPKVSCQRLSFADQLKFVSYMMFNWGGLQEAVYYENHPEHREVILPAIGLTPRQIWDEIGSRGADICPKVWPEMAFQSANADVCFVPDLRRPVEIEYVRQFNGFCYKVTRTAAPVSNHRVDTGLDDYEGWDGVIKNDGTLREFNHQIKILVAKALNPLVDQGFKVCPYCFAAHEAILSCRLWICGSCKEVIQ